MFNLIKDFLFRIMVFAVVSGVAGAIGVIFYGDAFGQTGLAGFFNFWSAAGFVFICRTMFEIYDSMTENPKSEPEDSEPEEPKSK